MTVQTLDECATIQPAQDTPLVELRGASGRLYAKLDPQTLMIEFKDRRDGQIERIDLRSYLRIAEQR